MKLSILLAATLAFVGANAKRSKYQFVEPDYCVPQAPAKDSQNIPRNFGMLLFQAFEPIDVFGPIQALFVLSKTYKLNLSLISQTLDPVTTRPVAAAMNAMNSSFFPEIVPTHTVANAPDLDVLIIPGGLGTRSPLLNATLDYIRTTAPKVKYIITVCSGSLLAARAGIMDGRIATTNKQSYKSTVTQQKNVKWVPHAKWTVDENLWTTSGISSGIDGTLAWIDCVFGEEVAYNISVYMEWTRVTDADYDPFAALSGVF